MTQNGTAVARAESMYKVGEWGSAHKQLWAALSEAPDERDAARLRLALVDGHNHEDFKRGRQERLDKYEMLDTVEELARSVGDDQLRARTLHLRGVALHIDFIMATGDLEREEACFTESAEIFQRLEDTAGYALATAFLGIFYHVDLLDRATARPILERALANADEKAAPIAHSEATRHLGQIEQELGHPTRGLGYLRESLRVRRESGWTCLIPSALHAIASAKLNAGDLEGAARDLARARDLAGPSESQLTLALVAKTEADLRIATLAPGVWRRALP